MRVVPDAHFGLIHGKAGVLTLADRRQTAFLGSVNESLTACRIQRIGQLRDTVDIYNMRYAGSVEDRVHALLSERLENIANLFGQIPDILEDLWIDLALGEVDAARSTIDAVPKQHPFQLRYHTVEKVDWESRAQVLDAQERKRFLARGWGE